MISLTYSILVLLNLYLFDPDSLTYNWNYYISICSELVILVVFDHIMLCFKPCFCYVNISLKCLGVFPIVSGMIGQNWWTKIIFPDNLVHTNVTTKGITNWSHLEYITARSNINSWYITKSLSLLLHFFVYWIYSSVQ